ncbi:MAG: glycerate kinase, partial [Phycisphaerales bacterium]|nr:glycerate kinase [Phycisphaerales bacterium]
MGDGAAVENALVVGEGGVVDMAAGDPAGLDLKRFPDLRLPEGMLGQPVEFVFADHGTGDGGGEAGETDLSTFEGHRARLGAGPAVSEIPTAWTRECVQNVEMRILIAPDSFKECLDAPAVARALGDGCLGHDVDLCPVADGGEGTA